MASRRLQVVLDLDTGRYTGRMGAAASQMRVFQGRVDSGSRSVRQLGTSFDGLNSSLATPLSKLRDYVLILGNIRLAILNVRDIAVGWVGSLIQQSAQVERLTILMKGLSSATTEVGRSTDAADNLRMLFGEARRTGFAVDALADSFVKMKSGGIDPTNGSLSALSNAVANFGGTSDVMHRASIAIQQMSGKGVISMEELRQQLGEAVPTAMSDMARAAGLSVKEFTDLVSKGVVQAGPALQLMFNEFEILYGGAGERIAGTLTGQIGQFKTNVMELATVFTGLNNGSPVEGGLFDSSKKALEQLNDALRSSEGRQFAADIGQAVNTVLTALTKVGGFIVKFRDEIGFAMKVIIGSFLAVRAAGVLQWMFATIGSVITALTGFRNATVAASGPIGQSLLNLTQRTTDYANAMRNQIAIQNGRSIVVQRDLALAQQESLVATRKALSLRAEQAALEQKILSERRAIAAARQAQVQAQANIATNVRLSASIQQSRAAKTDEALASIRLASAERALAAVKIQGAAATRAATAAVALETAAVARSTVAKGAATVAQRALSVAVTAGATAVRFFGFALNAALGPLGLIAFALYAAADAAGVFENRADKAAAATARLMQGIADLDAMKDAAARRDELREKKGELTDQIKSGRGAASASAVSKARSSIPEAKRELARVNKELANIDRALVAGQSAINLDAGNTNAAYLQNRRNQTIREVQEQSSTVLRSKTATDADKDAARRRAQNFEKGYDAGALKALQSRLDKARADGNKNAAQGIAQMIDQYKSANGITGDLVQTTEQLRSQLTGVGEDGASGGSQAAGGLSKAEKASKKLSDQYDQAREKYDQMIGAQTGDIAQLAAEVDGAEGALAEFRARVDAGLFGDALPQELKDLEEGFKRIDQLNRDKDFGKGIRQLRAEVAKTTEAANGLWRALQADSTGAAVVNFDRTEDVRANFADRVAEAEKTGDITKIRELNIEIEKAIQQTGRLDAARTSDAWRASADEIRTSLLGEEEARQVNFDREMARQAALITAIRNNAAISTEERIFAEQRYHQWRTARLAQLARENESQTVKMARDWAKLGQNIDGALSGALNSFVDGLFEAEFSFADFAKSLIKDLIKIILKALVAYAIMSALGLANNSSGEPVSLGGFLKGQIGAGFGGGQDSSTNIGFGAGSSAPIGGSAPGRNSSGNRPPPRPTGTVTIGHIGGIIGSLSQKATIDPSIFAGAKSYHTGTNSIGGRALRPGEVPMIGMKGEAVPTEEHQRAISKRLNASGEAQAAPVTVNIINNSNTELDAEQSEPEFNGREMIVNVVVEAAQKQGPLRDVLSGLSNR